MPPKQHRDPTISVTIEGASITLSANLKDVGEADLKASANRAIERLRSQEEGPTGVVIVLSFSHTAIISTTEGTPLDNIEQKKQAIDSLAKSAKSTREPESLGLSLKQVSCFTPPPHMNLNKLNIAGIGAKSLMDSEKVSSIYAFVMRQIGMMQFEPPASIATAIVDGIVKELQPILIAQAAELVKAYHGPRLDAMRKLIASEISAFEKRTETSGTMFDQLPKAAQSRVIEKTPYSGLVETAVFGIHHDNLMSGEAFKTFQHTDQSPQPCMLNKTYVRYNDPKEHLPGIDWNCSAIGRQGILIGNINISDTPLAAGVVDNSWKMDLITIVKILKKTDQVTTKDIIYLLHANGIINVIFIDGACNVFCSDDGMIACGGCDTSFDVRCDECQTYVGSHPWGGRGMKNKKTKKKARIVRTVRGRRMRKCYKRSKTYKRSKPYKR
jgi:hypothetical protein